MLILKQWKWKVSHQSIHLIQLQFILEDLSRENVLSNFALEHEKNTPSKVAYFRKIKEIVSYWPQLPKQPKSGQLQNFKRLLAKRKAVILANSIASQVQPFPGCCRTMGGKPTKTPQIVQYFFRVRSKRGVIFRILNGFWPSERRFVASQVQPFPGCCRTMGRKSTKTPQIVQYFFQGQVEKRGSFLES